MAAQEDVTAALKLLDNLIYASGRTKQDLDRKLGFSRGYLSRVLAGETRLTYELMLVVVDELGMDRAAFFNLLHQKRPARREAPAGWADDAWQQLGYGEAPPAGTTVEPVRPPAPLDLRILEAVRQVLAQQTPPAAAEAGARGRKKE
jgi:hypothetical protein